MGSTPFTLVGMLGIVSAVTASSWNVGDMLIYVAVLAIGGVMCLIGRRQLNDEVRYDTGVLTVTRPSLFRASQRRDQKIKTLITNEKMSINLSELRTVRSWFSQGSWLLLGDGSDAEVAIPLGSFSQSDMKQLFAVIGPQIMRADVQRDSNVAKVTGSLIERPPSNMTV